MWQSMAWHVGLRSRQEQKAGWWNKLHGNMNGRLSKANRVGKQETGHMTGRTNGMLCLASRGLGFDHRRRHRAA